MTAKAWLLTTWGRIRETLQPELFVLRRELAQMRAERNEAVTLMNQHREAAIYANRTAVGLADRLAQRTRELKVARARVRKLDADLQAARINMQDAAQKRMRVLARKRNRIQEAA